MRTAESNEWFFTRDSFTTSKQKIAQWNLFTCSAENISSHNSSDGVAYSSLLFVFSFVCSTLASQWRPRQLLVFVSDCAVCVRENIHLISAAFRPIHISRKMKCFRTILHRCFIPPIVFFLSDVCVAGEFARCVDKNCVSKMCDENFSENNDLTCSRWSVVVMREISRAQTPMGLVAAANTVRESIWFVPHVIRFDYHSGHVQSQRREEERSMLKATVRGSSIITQVCARASVNNGRRGQANTKQFDMTIDSYIFIFIQDYEFRMLPKS